MKSFDITSDGTVNIDFTHITGVGNPEINAVEIVNNSVGSNSNVAKRRQLRRHQRRPRRATSAPAPSTGPTSAAP